MTTFAKTWVTDGNRVPGDQSTEAQLCKWTLWWMKSILTNTGLGLAANAGAWSVYYSCDSVTAGTANDGVDRWTATFDGTKIIRASGAVAHSWMVLKSPSGLGSGPWYLIIQYNTTSDWLCNFIFCKAAPTGGSTTARPTSTNEWSPFTAQQFVNGTLANHHHHGNLATDGSVDLFLSKDGSGFAEFGFMFQAQLSPKSSDVAPVVAYVEWNAGGIWKISALSLVNSPRGIARDVTNASNVGWFCPIRTDAGGTTNIMTDMGTIDAEDSKYDDLQLEVYVFTTSHKSIRGVLADIAWAPTNAAQALTEPASGTTQTTVIGNTWHPWINVGAAPIF